jgi:cell division protein FtsW
LEAGLSRKRSFDNFLFALVLVLALFGLIMVYSASAVIALELYGNKYHFLIKHVLSLVAGLGAMVAAMHFKYTWFRKPWLVYTLVLASVLMLIGVLLVPAQNNANRWFRFGNFSFQPSEFAKIVLVIFLAYIIDKKKERLNDFFHGLFPCLLILAQFVSLILLEPDLGTAMIMLFITGVMLYVAGIKYRYVFMFVLVSIPAFYSFILNVEWRKQRLLAFLNPMNDPQGYGFQPLQSLMALGSGGIFGVGPAESTRKMFFLPEPHTDFIFSIIGEEYGLIGTSVIILLFVLLFWRGVLVSLRCQETFGFYLGIGLTFMVVVQAFMNISVALSLLPTKGLTLPLISCGGSSLVMTLASLGILLNISYND